MQSSSSKPKSRWPLLIVITLLVVVSVIFAIIFGTTNPPPVETSTELTASTYVEEVNALLQGSDSANGAVLIEQYQCVACHRVGVANGVAPSFVAIAETAATRRPPLTAAAYLYEAIVYPAVYVVEDYGPVMLQDYRERLTDRELGDIIAYLLTPDAH